MKSLQVPESERSLGAGPPPAPVQQVPPRTVLLPAVPARALGGAHASLREGPGCLTAAASGVPRSGIHDVTTAKVAA